MAEEEFAIWVNVQITEKQLAEKLDAMCEADERDRSKLIRWLIDQEWKRREGQAHWVGNEAEPLPLKQKAEGGKQKAESRMQKAVAG